MSPRFKSVVPTDELLRQVRAEELRKLEERVKRNEEELRSLHGVHAGKLQEYAGLLTQVWVHPAAQEGEAKFFDDPVHEHLALEKELGAVLAHPLVQRLNHIKQLSFAYLCYPSATHTRLSHCLGVCKSIEVALTTIFRNDVLYSAAGASFIALTAADRRELVLKAKAAALLHDVGHGPFGHALDRFIGFFDVNNPMTHPDKFYSRKYIETHLAEILSRSGVDPANLVALLRKDRTDLIGWDSLIADLIDSSLDVDRMDYLARDAHMSGLSMGITSVGALIERMCPFIVDNQVVLTYHHSCLPYVDDFLSARDRMFVTCYDHPRKLAAERVFTRLVQHLVDTFELGIETIMMMADEQILALLVLSAAGSPEYSQLLCVLLQNLAYEQILEVDLKHQSSTVQQWNSSRDGYGKNAYIVMPATWERTIAEHSGLGSGRAWQVLAVVPAHEVRVQLEGGVRILFPGTDGRFYTKKLFDVKPGLQSRLEEFTSERQKIRVFCDARLTAAERARVHSAAANFFAS